jgi:protein-S-isoprenylcysteine O-methyltransferase Ste14
VDEGKFLRFWLPLFLGPLFLALVFLAGPGPHDTARWIGLGLALFGFAGVIAARYSLGRSFSVQAKATELVTSGIYSRIRNPIYVFSFFFILGVVVMLRLAPLYIFPVAVIPIQIMRARKEAQVLEAKFGDAYRRYRAGTWF